VSLSLATQRIDLLVLYTSQWESMNPVVIERDHHTVKYAPWQAYMFFYLGCGCLIAQMIPVSCPLKTHSHSHRLRHCAHAVDTCTRCHMSICWVHAGAEVCAEGFDL
jgi:hypothetical protein